MHLSIVGATGFIGSQIVGEALSRGHAVTGIARNPGKLAARDGLTAVAADAADPDQLAKSLAGSDAFVVSVTWTNNDVEKILSALRSAGATRAIFVVGAGSLGMPDGRLWLDHMIEQGIAPPTSRKALEALRTLRSVSDIDWVAVSPSRDIEPGQRTGQFRLGQDDLLTDEEGGSRITTQDFAVAILDEIETPTMHRRRFTVGY
ncbi:NAD(P)H-binding protein [Methylopila sp. M107]|uniref:NAD(P)-dependent oxidoreductase n=1 Tax=Methylopila sp. M107 TaxID=1101190 RepID=UPI00036842B0|nr:NAD(P)H-binding protein [Methylopila sp. M107]